MQSFCRVRWLHFQGIPLTGGLKAHIIYFVEYRKSDVEEEYPARRRQRGDGRCKSLPEAGEGGFQASPLNCQEVGGGGSRRYRENECGPWAQIQVVPRTFVRPEPNFGSGRFLC